MHRYSIVKSGTPLNYAKKAMILLHGRGGTADDILVLGDELCNSDFYVAAPEATGNSWYPYSFMNPVENNEPWLTSALQVVKKLVDEIAVIIPYNKIFIAGFSQGACLSLEFAGRYPSDYAGIIAFSGGLIGDKLKPERYQGRFNGTKIFIGNSDADPHIPLGRTEESAEMLRNAGADVLLKIYPGMGHTIIPQEIDEVKNFMF